MADVTGPISTLPGSTHATPNGMMCDEHPDRPAVARVQGETDSFGSEMWDLCQECFDARKQSIREQGPVTGYCDWCKKEAEDIRDHRDFEEGRSGPIYQVCKACRKRESDWLEMELGTFFE